MAGSAPVEEKPQLGRGATITGLIFALLILGGFSAGTAASFRDTVSEKYSHSEEESHADEESHSEEESNSDESIEE